MKHLIIPALLGLLVLTLVAYIWLTVLFPAALRTYCP